MHDYLTFLQKGSGQIDERLAMAMICEKMCWTYEQYIDQPSWFIKLLMLKFSADADYQNKQSKKQWRQQRS